MTTPENGTSSEDQYFVAKPPSLEIQTEQLPTFPQLLDSFRNFDFDTLPEINQAVTVRNFFQLLHSDEVKTQPDIKLVYEWTQAITNLRDLAEFYSRQPSTENNGQKLVSIESILGKASPGKVSTGEVSSRTHERVMGVLRPILLQLLNVNDSDAVNPLQLLRVAGTVQQAFLSAVIEARLGAQKAAEVYQRSDKWLTTMHTYLVSPRGGQLTPDESRAVTLSMLKNDRIHTHEYTQITDYIKGKGNPLERVMSRLVYLPTLINPAKEMIKKRKSS